MSAMDENQTRNLANTERTRNYWKGLGASKRVMRDREGCVWLVPPGWEWQERVMRMWAWLCGCELRCTAQSEGHGEVWCLTYIRPELRTELSVCVFVCLYRRWFSGACWSKQPTAYLTVTAAPWLHHWGLTQPTWLFLPGEQRCLTVIWTVGFLNTHHRQTHHIYNYFNIKKKHEYQTKSHPSQFFARWDAAGENLFATVITGAKNCSSLNTHKAG